MAAAFHFTAFKITLPVTVSASPGTLAAMLKRYRPAPGRLVLNAYTPGSLAGKGATPKTLLLAILTSREYQSY